MKRKTCGIMLLFCLLGFIMILTGIRCEKKNPIEDIIPDAEVTVNFNPVSTTVSGIFIDAATSEPIDDQTIEVTINGIDNGAVVDLAGSANVDYTVENGFLGFGIHQDVIPTEDLPLKLVIVAKAEGYLPTSLPVTISHTNGTAFELRMVNIQNPPDGIVAIQNQDGEVDSEGKLISELQIQTPRVFGAGAKATVRIPQNTVIEDEFGNRLSGKLTTTVVFYSNQSEEALKAFPGGLEVTLQKNEAGIPDEGFFITGGLVDIEIKDSHGNIGEKFISSGNGVGKVSADDDPVEFTVEIPGETINPETGAPLKDGDKISCWNYDSFSRTWNFIRDIEIRGPTADGMYIAFSKSHFAFLHNWDWFKVCNRPSSITVTGSQSIVLQAKSSGFFRQWFLTPENPSIKFLKSPPVELNIFAYHDGVLVGSTKEVDLCKIGDVVINLDQDENMEVYVNASCLCGNLKIRPTIPVYYKKVGSNEWTFAGKMINGKLLVKGLEKNATYRFKAIFGGTLEKEHKATIGSEFGIIETIEVEDFVLPADVCVALSSELI